MTVHFVTTIEEVLELALQPRTEAPPAGAPPAAPPAEAAEVPPAAAS
jgi:hypothetical protein